MNIKGLLPVLLVCVVSWVHAQDTIVFRNGHRLLAEVIRESPEKVQYKKREVERSPVYILEKRFVTAIRYEYPDSAALLFFPDSAVFEKELDVWVMPTDKGVVMRGLLHGINDSVLTLKRKSVLFQDTRQSGQEVFSLSYDKIQHIEMRRQRRVRQYAIWGAAIGFAAGTITGLAVFNDASPCDPSVLNGRPCDESLSSPHSQVEKALLMGAGGMAGGMLTGGLIGAIKIRLPVGGRKDQYNAAVPRIRRMARYLDE